MHYPIVIIDAGGTKTEILVAESAEKFELFNLPGYNPNRDITEFLIAFEKFSFPENAVVHFYGAGLESQLNKAITEQLFISKNAHSITIETDQLGAARAALGINSGLVSILGTGAFVGYYDGIKLAERKGGFGYLIDDIGGGLELGKYIVSKWLNNELSENLDENIKNKIGLDKESFLPHFYKNTDLKLIASLPSLLLQFGNEVEKDNIAVNYFNLFASRHLALLNEKYKCDEIHLVGSIAEHFKPYIEKSLAKFGIKKVYLVHNQTQKLLSYHQHK